MAEQLVITAALLVKGETEQVSDKFKKREFVMELKDDINGNTYTNYAKFQLVQAKCEILDKFNIGDMITVHFNIKGNRWERDGKVNYITNLDAWKLEMYSQAPQSNAPTYSGTLPVTDAAHPAFGEPDPKDNLPF